MCEYDVDECRQNPCHNGAICINLYGSFTCNCSSGIGGELCDEVDLISITSNPANINMDEILGIVGKASVNRCYLCQMKAKLKMSIHLHTLTFQIGVHIRLFIFRKSAALYDTIRVYTFIRFVANPPYTIFIWSMFISSPILWIITSRVGSLLPFYRPAACLEAHPAGVPGNCHLPASLSLRPHWAPGTRKLLLTKCLRICDKVTKGYIWSTTTLYAIGPTAFAWLIHNSSVYLGGCFGR